MAPAPRQTPAPLAAAAVAWRDAVPSYPVRVSESSESDSCRDTYSGGALVRHRGGAAACIALALDADALAAGDIASDWAARRSEALRRHGLERVARLRAAADEARARLEATPGSICSEGLATAGIGSNAAANERARSDALILVGGPRGWAADATEAVSAAAAQVAASCAVRCGGGGAGSAVEQYLDWALNVASQSADLRSWIEAERAERRHLREQLAAVTAAAIDAGAPDAGPRGQELQQRLEAAAARLAALLAMQQQAESLQLDRTGSGKGERVAASGEKQPAAAGRTIWEHAMALGSEPWRAFSALLSTAASLRARLEEMRARVDDAESEAALRRQLAEIAEERAAALAGADVDALGTPQARVKNLERQLAVSEAERLEAVANLGRARAAASVAQLQLRDLAQQVAALHATLSQVSPTPWLHRGGGCRAAAAAASGPLPGWSPARALSSPDFARLVSAGGPSPQLSSSGSACGGTTRHSGTPGLGGAVDAFGGVPAAGEGWQLRGRRLPLGASLKDLLQFD